MSTEPNLQALRTAVLGARTVAELEEPMTQGIYAFLNARQQPMVSDLWQVVDLISERITTIGGLADLGGGDDLDDQNPRAKLVNWFGGFCSNLARADSYVTATQLLIELWNQVGVYQRTHNKDASAPRHFYRAGVGLYLGRIFASREPGAAIWWLLHAHADDLLTGHPNKGGAARDVLRLTFGVRDQTFDFLERSAENCRNSGEPHALFAEHVVMQLSLEPDHTYLFSQPTALTDFPIGRAYAASMLDRIAKIPEGPPLEEFARYLLLLLAGWVPTKNLYHPRTEIDSDLVARYSREPEAISSAHARAILVECKNINRPLGVSGVGYFLYRMHLTHVDIGILFAKENVSGRNPSDDRTEEKNARHLIDLAFQRDGRTVIVVDMNDLQELAEAKRTIWSLIDGRITERRFGAPHR